MAQDEYTRQVMAVASEAGSRALAARAVADDLLAEAVRWGRGTGLSLKEIAASTGTSASATARMGLVGSRGPSGYQGVLPELYELAFAEAIEAVVAGLPSGGGENSPEVLRTTLAARVGLVVE